MLHTIRTVVEGTQDVADQGVDVAHHTVVEGIQVVADLKVGVAHHRVLLTSGWTLCTIRLLRVPRMLLTWGWTLHTVWLLRVPRLLLTWRWVLHIIGCCWLGGGCCALYGCWRYSEPPDTTPSVSTFCLPNITARTSLSVFAYCNRSETGGGNGLGKWGRGNARMDLLSTGCMSTGWNCIYYVHTSRTTVIHALAM